MKYNQLTLCGDYHDKTIVYYLIVWGLIGEEQVFFHCAVKACLGCFRRSDFAGLLGCVCICHVMSAETSDRSDIKVTKAKMQTHQKVIEVNSSTF